MTAQELNAIRLGLAMAIIAVVARPLHGQSPQAFEVASIKLHQGTIIMVGLDVSGNRVTVSASRISDLIADAYNLKGYQLAGVAEWMRADRYDVVAKAASDATPTTDQARQMLQALLVDRFGLNIHREPREMLVYGWSQRRVAQG